MHWHLVMIWPVCTMAPPCGIVSYCGPKINLSGTALGFSWYNAVCLMAHDCSVIHSAWSWAQCDIPSSCYVLCMIDKPWDWLRVRWPDSRCHYVWAIKAFTSFPPLMLIMLTCCWSGICYRSPVPPVRAWESSYGIRLQWNKAVTALWDHTPLCHVFTCIAL